MQETFFFPLEYLDQKNSENLESAIKSFRTEDIKLTIYIYISGILNREKRYCTRPY
jgi:hypothetical protein